MNKLAFGQGKESVLDRIIKHIRYQQIIKLIPHKSFVVDLGCGYNGDLLRILSSKIDRGIGFDLKISRKSPSDNIVLKKAKVDQKIPVKRNIVDVVTALAIIEHLEHPDKFLSEIYRVLRPGGMLLLTTPSQLSKPLLEFLAFKVKIISQGEIKDHKRYFNIIGIKKALTNVGFSKRNINVTTFELRMNILAKAIK